MRIDLITLFPEITQALHYGITGRALKRGLLNLHTWNPRDYTNNKHRTVDDRPYGGGPGMVMTIQPLQDAIQAAQSSDPIQSPVVYLSPRGQTLNQSHIQKVATQTRLILVAGRYEGIDERLIQSAIDEMWSIGDYVLSGGEIAGLVVIDCIARLLPGALNSEESAKQESFNEDLLDWPHYTRPAIYQEACVPKVLLKGNHKAIRRWRLQHALGQTWLRRPELLKKRSLTPEEQYLLDTFIENYQQENEEP